MSPAEDTLNAVAAELRVSGGVVILGAGASYEGGMPLAGQLAPMIWHILDDHEDVRMAVAASLGVPHSRGKSLIGDSWDRMLCAFNRIAEAEDCWRAFQAMFVALDSDRRRRFSPTHDAVAQLVHAQFIVTIPKPV